MVVLILATYFLQAAVCGVTALVVLHFQRAFGRAPLRLWGLSWAALAVHHAGAGALFLLGKSQPAAGAPQLGEIGVFVIPESAQFDPAAPWRLQLLVQRATGALDKAFVSVDLPYAVPARYLKQPPAAAGAAVAGGAAAAAPGGEQPLWQRMWMSRAASTSMISSTPLTGTA